MWGQEKEMKEAFLKGKG